MKNLTIFAVKSVVLVAVLVCVFVGAGIANAQVSPSVSITAGDIDLSYGEVTDIYWYPHYATSCMASGGSLGWPGSKYQYSSSFQTGELYQTTTFTITCSNVFGSASDSVTVYVAGAPVYYPTISMSADNTNISYNGSTTIRWSTANADSCNGTNGANGWAGSKNTNSAWATGPLTSTTTYTLTCTNSSGTETQSVTVNVAGQQFTNPSVSTSSATNVGTSFATLNGFVNANGNNNIEAWFEWGTSGNFFNQTNKLNYGSTSGTSYSYALSGLTQNTTYNFRAVARNTNGQTVYGNSITFITTNDVCYNCYNTNAPSITTYSATNVGDTYATLNAYVDPAGSYTTRWFEYGTSSSALFSSTSKLAQGTSAGNFNQYVSGLAQNTVYYFRAVAQNQNGTRYGNVLTFNTNTGNIYYNNCPSYGTCTPGAVTTIATNVDHNSARLNGLGLVYGNVSTNGYFEWGTTTTLGNTTTLGFIGTSTSSPFYSSLFNLTPNTTYFFRAVVQNQHGTARGDIQSFRTGNSPVINTTTTNVIYRDVVRNVVTNVVDETGVAKPSLVFLSVSRNNESIQIGENIDYVVYYKNVSTKALKDVVLTVAFPKEVVFVDTNRGYFSEENNTVVVNINELDPGEEGSVRIDTELLGSTEAGKIIVVTAHLAYTIVEDDTQEEVFAYSKNTIEDGSGRELTGLALFGGDFWPTTLIGWMLLILLILLALLFLRNVYLSGRRNTGSHLDKPGTL